MGEYVLENEINIATDDNNVSNTYVFIPLVFQYVEKKGEAINEALSIWCTNTLKRTGGRWTCTFMCMHTYVEDRIPPGARDGALNEKRGSVEPSFIRKCPRNLPRKGHLCIDKVLSINHTYSTVPTTQTPDYPGDVTHYANGKSFYKVIPRK
ncbi:uncharacterized protein LOC143424942 [Xylocopa sonorina]|uniref:uncharacterized protein LOC143424942 n=1 Tax=Xylocopa sonorina TaxID=1818115 RepID=UPI00403AFC23